MVVADNKDNAGKFCCLTIALHGLQQLCQYLEDETIVAPIINIFHNLDPSVSVSSASTPRGDTIRQGSRSQMRTVRFQLDKFISFEMDSDEADLLFFIRQKYQVCEVLNSVLIQ